jgi:ketosteroid isomerase-like protein
MRVVLCAVALSCVLTFDGTRAEAQARGPQGSPVTADQRALYRLEDQWAEALVKRDSMFFRRTLARDYVYSDERGVFTKEQVIAEQTSLTDTVTFATNEGMRAIVHGPTAVVVGILVVRGRGKAGPFEHRFRYTDTWAKRDGRWVMVASQDYDIPR